jgi:hypothetical protein
MKKISDEGVPVLKFSRKRHKIKVPKCLINEHFDAEIS